MTQTRCMTMNPVSTLGSAILFDILSQGRAIAGLGIGWSKDEYQVSGVPYKHRGERANEFLQLLKRLSQSNTPDS